MVYADYDFYINGFFGQAISEDGFPRLALRGSQYIDYITQGRAEARRDLEAVKMCCCALAEQYQTIDAAQALAQKSLSASAADGTEVQSETVGSWSRSYRSGGSSAAEALGAAAGAGGNGLYQIALRYLAHTGLLYRGGEVPVLSMFPHTITMYNVEIVTDKATLKDVLVNHITILHGVLLDASKAINVRESGLEGADAVNLYIPSGVEASDGVTGKRKKYAAPLEFWRAEDKSEIWTMSIGGTKTPGTDGSCFFVKGIAVHPDLPVDIIEMMYDHVYDITSIDEKDFGGLQHWEVGAKQMSFLSVSLRDDFSDVLMKKLEAAGPQASHAVAVQVAKDTEPFVPAMTKSLVDRTQVVENRVVYPGPYARYLYNGKVMVDSATGKGPMRIVAKDGTEIIRFRKGAVLKPTEKPLKISQAVHPQAQDHWFEGSKVQNLEKWAEVAEKAVKEKLGE